MRKFITKILLIGIILFWFWSITTVSANYTKNINDEIKIFNIEKKLQNILKKYPIEKQKILKNIIKSKIEKILWKSTKEIFLINIHNKNFSSFKEYFLVRIYWDMYYGVYFSFRWYKIVETDYARILVYLYDKNTNIKVESDWFFYEWNKYQFFKLPKWINTSLYIKQKFIWKFLWKCEVKKIDKDTYILRPIWNYMKWKNWIEQAESCWFKAYSNFKKISENVLMYSEFWQAWNGVDLSSIELK